MPRKGKQAKHLVKAGAKAAEVNRVTDADRAKQAGLPPLVAQGPKYLKEGAVRPEKPRTAREQANAAWRKAVDMFDQVPLTAKEGSLDKPTNDYGGLTYHFDFDLEQGVTSGKGSDHKKVGAVFRGVPACKKRGQSVEHVPKNAKSFMSLLIALLTSCADVPFSGYFSRFSAIFGARTKWHTDSNTRGSQANAMRCLQPNRGGILLFKRISFRCSMIWFKEQIVVPWSLDSSIFRFMCWDSDGKAWIDFVAADEFWKLARGVDPTIGLLEYCLINLSQGQATGCILVGEDCCKELPEKSMELTGFSFAELHAQALQHPLPSDQPIYETHGFDGKWSIWFGCMLLWSLNP